MLLLILIKIVSILSSYESDITPITTCLINTYKKDYENFHGPNITCKKVKLLSMFVN
jgi:hypothetical protein